MRKHLATSALCLSSFLLCASKMCGQQSTPVSSVRDPQAVTILNQALSAAGGVQALAAIQDTQAAGSVSYNWANGPVQGSVTTKSRGTTQFRTDANLSVGTRSVIVNNGTGLVIQPDGSVYHLSSSSALNLGALFLPYSQLLGMLNDSLMSVSYVGLISKAGQQVVQIHLQKTLDPSVNPSGVISLLTTKDVFIDPSTFQLLAIQDTAGGSHIHETQYASYRQLNGILVPFSITEIFDGQAISTVVLNQVTFNNGLSDSDFYIDPAL